MFTLNKIVKIQEDFATGHRQVNDFVFDQAYSYESKPELKYPLLWIDLEGSDVSEAENSEVWSDSFVFNVAIIGLVREDKSNEQDVLSDCKLILNDYLIYLRQANFPERIKVETTVSMKPVRMSGQDLTSGWQCQVKIGFITDPDYCGIPMDSAPSYPAVIYTPYNYQVAWGDITGTLANQTDLQAALDAKVPTSRTLTINGTTYDLSANRSWTISTGGETLAQTLILGNTSGNNHLLMNDDYYVGLGTGATNRGKLYRDSANSRILLEHGTTGDYLSFGDLSGVLLKAPVGAIYADGIGNTVGLNWNESANQIQSFNLNGLWSIGTTELQLWHDTKLNLDAPIYTFSQLTASTVPYLDVSKNLVSSTVTPTQLGYLDATSSIQTQLNAKQATLVSGTNIKTVGGISLLGSGDIGSISTTYTDAKIKGSIAATSGLIPYGLGVADTVTSSTAFKYTGNGLEIGTGTTFGTQRLELSQASAASTMYIRNNLASAASSVFLIDGIGLANSLRFQLHGSTFASTGITQANTGALFTVGTSIHMNIGSYGSAETRFWTSNIQRASIDSSGFINLGTYGTPSAQRLVTIGDTSTWVSIGSQVGTATNTALYFNQSTPSATNYTLFANATQTVMNGSSSINFRIGDTNKITLTSSGQTITPGQGVAGTSIFQLTTGNNSNQTAGANVPKMLFTIGTTSWATGALAAADFVQWTQPSVLFTAASTATLAATFAINGAPIASTNASITTSVGLLVKAGSSVAAGTTTAYGAYINAPSGATTNYALGVNGVTDFLGNVRLTQTVTTEALTSDTSVTIVINGTTYKLLAKA